MRRTDRLFDLIQIVRDGRLHLARDLADQLGVSVRTIYRDMETLVASGVPVEGERGVGYLLREPIFLPPMNLSRTELEALHLGVALVAAKADPELQQAARSLSEKIEQSLPSDRKAPDGGWGFEVFASEEIRAGFRHMPVLRRAIREKRKTAMDYQRLDGTPTQRLVRPLNLEYWSRVWTCTAWCETRDDFRVFRVDRITALELLPDTYVDEPGKRLDDYRAADCS